MTKREEAETLDGFGEVSLERDGTSVGRRRYRLTISQELTQGDAFERHSPPVPGVTAIKGWVHLHDGEASILMGKDLVLRLDDGRTFRFFYESIDGSIGARGGIEK